MFERLDTWTPHRRPGAWPDADMIPLGVVDFGRPTHFTRDEQYTLMTLWSIGRSPLIFGGDMTKLDTFTLSLLTNPEVLAVNRDSTNNRQVFNNKNLVAWTADVPGSKDKYLALFNAQSKDESMDFAFADYASPVITGEGASQEVNLSVQGGKKLVLFVKDGGNGVSFDHVSWLDPILKGPKGELKLTDLKWETATSGWGEPRVNRTSEDQPLLLKGTPVKGIGTHSESTIIYNLPEGYDTFSTKGVVTRDGGSVVFGVLVDRGAQAIADTSEVKVNLADIGTQGQVTVRDLWAKKDLGTFNGSFGQKLPLHGAGLYRIKPRQ